MAAPRGEQVYATLLLSDSYLPGALVLAHSLRDAGTSHKLAILVTLDTVSADAVTQLKAIFDYVLPVPRIRNEHPANLELMNRTDLHSAFTKINLWKLEQFSKIVYIDADVVAYRAPDELFRLEYAFSAAPDIGWPDLFNTGVMALTPNLGDYYAMMAMAERGISFDGADQGLLNMHFKNSVNRLSFTYNVTPSAHYQYIPAYRHFQSTINMVHFIGPNKPWFAGRNAPHGNSPFDQMVGRWWAVYDRHYRTQESTSQGSIASFTSVQNVTTTSSQQSASSSQPASGSSAGHDPSSDASSSFVPSQSPSGLPPSQPSPASAFGHEHSEAPPPGSAHPEDSATSNPSSFSESFANSQGASAEARSDHQQAPPPQTEAKHESPPPIAPSWDAQRQPPPLDSKPEAMNFPATHYEMSQDAGLFIPPARYPSPPKNMWFDVPKEPPSSSAHRPQSIFPWEVNQPRPSRYFAGDQPEQEAPTEPSTQGDSGLRIDTRRPQTADSSARPSTPTITVSHSDPWTSFPRLNAWDDMPEIGRYVEGLQKHRRVKSQGSATSALRAPSPSRTGAGSQKRAKPPGFKLTDFPSETERPSLPVTPAPIRRPSFWGDDNTGYTDDSAKQPLPAAEGVPAQSEWDPATQLQKLAQQQSEALLRKLGSEGFETGVSRDIPTRPMPFGSEDLKLPVQPREAAGPGSPSRQQPPGRVPSTVDRASSSFTSAPEPGPTS